MDDHYHRHGCNRRIGSARFIDVSLGEVHGQSGARTEIQAASDVLRGRDLWIRHCVRSRTSVNRQSTSMESSLHTDSALLCLVLLANCKAGSTFLLSNTLTVHVGTGANLTDYPTYQGLALIGPFDFSSDAATHCHLSDTFRNPYKTVSPFGVHRV